MKGFLARRLAGLILLFLIVSFGVFVLQEAAPGSTEQVLLGAKSPSPDVIHAIRVRYHLDEPLLIRYWDWLTAAMRLDFGESIRTGENVRTAIFNRASFSAMLALMAFTISTAVGIPLGMLAALRRRTGIDRSVVALGVAGVSAPPFATGTALIFVFAVLLRWFPASGGGSGSFDQLWHLVLPSIAVALTAIAYIIKITRASMVRVLDQDFITFARARGIPERTVLFSFALRNALIPVVTASGLVLAYMLAGVVVVEITFDLPGLGALLVDAVKFYDVTVVQGIAVCVLFLVVVVNLATDIAYVIIDPRIRFGSDHG